MWFQWFYVSLIGYISRHHGVCLIIKWLEQIIPGSIRFDLFLIIDGLLLGYEGLELLCFDA